MTLRTKSILIQSGDVIVPVTFIDTYWHISLKADRSKNEITIKLHVKNNALSPYI